MICQNCFNLLDENEKVCPFCKSTVNTDIYNTSNINQNEIKYSDMLFNAPEPNNINNNFSPQQKISTTDKVLAVLSYLGIFSVIAFFVGKTNYLKRHGLQGIVLYISINVYSFIINFFMPSSEYIKTLTAKMTADNAISIVTDLYSQYGLVLFLTAICSIFFLILRIKGIISAISNKEPKLSFISALAKKICPKYYS